MRFTETMVGALVAAIRPIFKAHVDPYHDDDDYKEALRVAVAGVLGKMSIQEARCMYHAITAIWNGPGLDEKSIEYRAVTMASDVLESWASKDIRAQTLEDVAIRVQFLWEQGSEDIMDGDLLTECLSSLRSDIRNVRHPERMNMPDDGHFHYGCGWTDDHVDAPDKVVTLKPVTGRVKPQRADDPTPPFSA